MKKYFSKILLVIVLVLTFTSTIYAAPAPATAPVIPPYLTYLYVRTVASKDAGIEDIEIDQASTVKDHGATLIITTFEIGNSSSSSRIAKLNGIKLQNLLTHSFDLNKDGIIDSYRRWWVGDNNQFDGDFTYQATSIDPPYNTMSTKIHIK